MSPMMFSSGTTTSSNSTYAVPDPLTPMQSMARVETPLRFRSISSREMPIIPEPSPPVRTAVVKKSANMPQVIHFFKPLTM